MKIVLLVLMYLNLFNSGLPDYRKLLDDALYNKEAATVFYETLKTVKETDAPVLIGFRAMSEFMLCKHLLNPISRISHFNKGKELLGIALSRDENDPELLYFRLSTQSNTPALLGYKSNIDTDKLMLIHYLKTAADRPGDDKMLDRRIKAYLLINQYCSMQEKAIIRSL